MKDLEKEEREEKRSVKKHVVNCTRNPLRESMRSFPAKLFPVARSLRLGDFDIVQR